MIPRRRRGPSRLRRARHRAEAAASEVVGYILMLFLSSIVLMVSLQAFLTSRETVQDLQGGRELNLIVHRLAAEVEQAAFVASEMPNATFEARLDLPELAGRSFYVEARGGQLWANTTDGELVSETEIEVDSLDRLTLQGKVHGSQGYALIRYERHPASGDRWINLTL